jgi:hypothetical protein
MAGSLQMVPVQAAVKTLYSSGDDPQLTNSAGSGYIMVPGLQFCFITLIPNNGTKIDIFFLTHVFLPKYFRQSTGC